MKTILEETETRIRARPSTNGRGKTHGRAKGRTRSKRKTTTVKPAARRSPTLVSRLSQPMAYFNVLRDYATACVAGFVDDQTDLVRRRSREVVQFATSRLICGALVLAVALMAVVMTLQGISGALAEAYGGRAWAGDLTTAGILAVAALGAWLYMKLSARDDRGHDQEPARRRR
jgi:hypothetical protein